MNERIRYALDEGKGVGTITLARPEKRNALDPRTISEMEEALAAAEADDRVRVILLAAEGKDFCSGVDLEHLQDLDARELGRLFVHMRWLPKPIVAAVQGSALAGGAGLASACDILLASDDAHLGYPEVHIGFVPAIVMTMLVRAVGEKRAFELAATGRRVEAKEAHAIGLVHCVFSRHTFADDARGYAAEMAEHSASSIALSKRLLYELDELTFEEGIERGVEVNGRARQSEDCRAGVAEFLERKRAARAARESGP